MPQVEVNKEHQITDKIGSGLKKAGANIKAFDSKHDVSGKVTGGISSLMNGITKAVQPKDGGSSSR